MIRLVSIEREFGSGGGGIAQALADRLSWAFWDHAITCEIARRLKCDIAAVEKREERLDPTFYRLMKAFMRGSYEGSIEAGTGIELLDAEHLAAHFDKLVNDIAKKGSAVIVGRGAPYFLRERTDGMHIFVYAPRAEKLRRLRAQGREVAEAEGLLDTVDKERAAFVKKYYGKDWPDRSLYHLLINSNIGDEAVISMILHEMELINKGAGANDAPELAAPPDGVTLPELRA
ncbi:MAG: cytidylate kinase-like family protein [Bryobacteraceae bacterium]